MAIELPVGPQGRIESRQGSEGRVAIPRDPTAALAIDLLTTAAGAMNRNAAAKQEAEEKAAQNAAVTEAIDVQLEAGQEAARAASFNPNDPLQKKLAELEASGAKPNPLEAEAIAEAYAVRDAYMRALKQGVKPGDAAAVKLRKTRELIDRHPGFAKDIVAATNLASPIIDEAVKAAGADNAAAKAQVAATRNDMRTKVVAAGFAWAASLADEQIESVYDTVIGQYERVAQREQRIIDSLKRRTDLGNAERAVMVLEAGEELARSGVVLTATDANSILVTAAPVEEKVKMLLQLATEYEGQMTATLAGSGIVLGSDDYERLVGRRAGQLRQMATDLQGGVALQAIVNRNNMTVELEKARVLQTPGAARSAAITDAFRGVLNTNPNIAADHAAALARAVVAAEKAEAGDTPQGLDNVPDPARPGRMRAPEQVAREDASMTAALMGTGNLPPPAADAIVRRVEAIAATTKPTKSYRQLIPIIGAMADRRFADTVNASTVPLETRQTNQQLAKEYAENVDALIKDVVTKAGGPDSVDVTQNGGLFTLTPSKAWKGDRRLREQLSTYNAQLNAAVKAYAHANGMTAYEAAANAMFGE